MSTFMTTNKITNNPILLCPQYSSLLQDRENKRKEFLELTQKNDPKSFFFIAMPENEKNKPKIVNGFGLVSVDGFITNEYCEYEQYWGDVSCERVKRDIETHLKDEQAHTIILCINSPGGGVAGVQNLAKFIRETNSKKKIIAVINSMCCSAAYWIASACENIYHSEDTNAIGSIGVYLLLPEYSEYFAKVGIVVNEIKSSEYKTMGSPYRAMNDKEKEEFQRDIEILYNLFVSSVSSNRGIEEKKVIETGAKVYRGQEATKLGLSDGLLTLEGILMGKNKTEKEPEKVEDEEEKTEVEETEEESEPKQMEEEEAENKEKNKKAAKISSKREKELIALGAKRERERIQGIKEITQEGMETFMNEQISSGASISQAAIAQAKEIKKNGISLGDIKKDSKTVPSSFSDSGQEKTSLASLVSKKYRKN